MPTHDEKHDEKSTKAAKEEAPPEGSVSPEGIPYQAPSRPFAEQDEPGVPPPYDAEVEREEALAAQRDAERARYTKK